MVMFPAAVFFEARLFSWFFRSHFRHGHRFPITVGSCTALWQGNEIRASTIRESNVNSITTMLSNTRRIAHRLVAGIPPTSWKLKRLRNNWMPARAPMSQWNPAQVLLKCELSPANCGKSRANCEIWPPKQSLEKVSAHETFAKFLRLYSRGQS
jgi:hypothetical protein